MRNGAPLARFFILCLIHFHDTVEKLEIRAIERGAGSVLLKALTHETTSLDVVHFMRLYSKVHRIVDIWSMHSVFPLQALMKATARQDAPVHFWVREAVCTLLNLGCQFYTPDDAGVTAASLLPLEGLFCQDWFDLVLLGHETSSLLTNAISAFNIGPIPAQPAVGDPWALNPDTVIQLRC
jgi:hypothetical protein